MQQPTLLQAVCFLPCSYLGGGGALGREVLLGHVLCFETERDEMGRRTSYSLGKITP